MLGRLISSLRSSLFSQPSKIMQMGGVRWTTYGQEYQPSTRRRKRKFGFLARLWSKDGRKILHRRILKGRARLSA